MKTWFFSCFGNIKMTPEKKSKINQLFSQSISQPINHTK